MHAVLFANEKLRSCEWRMENGARPQFYLLRFAHFFSGFGIFPTLHIRFDTEITAPFDGAWLYAHLLLFVKPGSTISGTPIYEWIIFVSRSQMSER